MAEEMRICPNCGEKNLLQASRCVHCGLELEEFFRIENQDDTPTQSLPSQEDEEGLPEMLRDLQRPDLGGVFGESNENEATKPIKNTPEQAKPQMPDWLSRVRERAKVEDPSGDLIKKVSAADEVKEDSNRVAQEFDAWIGRLQDSAKREAMLKAKNAQPSEPGEDGVPDWLQRVRELQPNPEEQVTEEVKLTSSDEPQIPAKWDSGWSEEDLEKLRRGEYLDPEKVTKPADDELNAQELPEDEAAAEPEIDDESGVTSDESNETLAKPAVEHQISDLGDENESIEQLITPLVDDELPAEDAEVPALPELSEKKATEEILPDLLLLKSQNERVELLRTLISQEGKPSFAPKIGRPQQHNLSQVVLAGLLLVGIIGALLFGGSVWPKNPSSQAANVAFVDAINQIEPGDTVLVVLDYQAATSAEVEIGASETLRLMLERGANLELQTIQTSELWLVDSLRRQPGLAHLPEAHFIPGGALGMLIQTLYLPADPLVTPAVAPDGTQLTSLRDYTRVLVISDSSLSIRGWMEQINPWLPAGTMLFIAPHQEAVDLSVYYDSGQIGGYLAGMREYSTLSNSDAVNEIPLTSYRAYQVGMLIMIMFLLLGMVLKADQDADRKIEAEVIE